MYRIRHINNGIRKILKDIWIEYPDEDLEKTLSLLKSVFERIIKLEDDDELGIAIECLTFLRFLLLDFNKIGIFPGHADSVMLFAAYLRLINNDMVSKTVKLAIIDELLDLDEDPYDFWVGKKEAELIMQAVLRYDLWNDLWSDKFKRYLKRERDW